MRLSKLRWVVYFVVSLLIAVFFSNATPPGYTGAVFIATNFSPWNVSVKEKGSEHSIGTKVPRESVWISTTFEGANGDYIAQDADSGMFLSSPPSGNSGRNWVGNMLFMTIDERGNFDRSRVHREVPDGR